MRRKTGWESSNRSLEKIQQALETLLEEQTGVYKITCRKLSGTMEMLVAQPWLPQDGNQQQVWYFVQQLFGDPMSHEALMAIAGPLVRGTRKEVAIRTSHAEANGARQPRGTAMSAAGSTERSGTDSCCLRTIRSEFATLSLMLLSSAVSFFDFSVSVSNYLSC